MTVSSAVAKSGPYTGADDFVFAYNFRVFADAEIQVTTVVIATGVEEILTLTTDYTVQDAGDATGTITLTAGTFPTGLPSTKKLVVSRDMGFLQEIDFENQGGFFPDTHEDGFDRLKMEVQQVKEEVGRSVKVDITGTTTPDDLLDDISDSVAAASASAAAAATSESNAATSETNADADATATAADAVSTAADAAATAADAIATAADAVSTAADAAATAADEANTDADAIATAADAVSTAADAVSTAADAASAAAAWDAFDDTYLGAKASDPALDNDGDALAAGALYFNTTDSVMRVYDGSSWTDVGSSTAVVYQYSSTTAGQTAITGADDNAKTLSYTAGFAQVFYNGKLLSDTDYTETSSSVITLADGINVDGDVITILAFGTFDVANTYTQAQSDANYAPKATNTGEVATTSGASVTWSSIPAWVTKITLLFNEVSMDGADNLRVTLGDSSGLKTSGYVCRAGVMRDTGTSFVLNATDGFLVYAGDTVAVFSGSMVLDKVADDDWVESHAGTITVSRTNVGGGKVALPGTLTQAKLDGSAAGNFDNGSVTLIYE